MSVTIATPAILTIISLRFCYSCIMTWLGEGKTCPHDNSSLGEGDIFPDTIANREIMQLLI